MVVATVLGLLFIWLTMRFARERSMPNARPSSCFRLLTCRCCLARWSPISLDLTPVPVHIEDLPTLNAALNALASVFLVTAYVFIRRPARAPQAIMLAALVTSALFLASYVTYHANAGSRPFPGQVQFESYTSQSSSARAPGCDDPAAGTDDDRPGLRSQFDRHVRIARWTLPLWLYVSVTGVVIYLMLYRLYDVFVQYRRGGYKIEAAAGGGQRTRQEDP